MYILLCFVNYSTIASLYIIIPGFHFDADLWVSNSDITLSSPTVEEGQVGNVSLNKPSGGLAYKSDDMYPLFICETREYQSFYHICDELSWGNKHKTTSTCSISSGMV